MLLTDRLRQWTRNPIVQLCFTIMFITFYVRLVDNELYDLNERRTWLLVSAVIFDTTAIIAACHIGSRRIRLYTNAVLLFLLWLLCMADVLSLRFYGTYFNMRLISETQNLNGLGDSIMSLVHTSDYVVTVIYTLLSALYLSNIRKQKQYELKKCFVSFCIAFVAFILPYVHERLNLFSTFEEQMARYNYDYCFERPHYGIACGILKTAFADLMYLDATRPTTK